MSYLSQFIGSASPLWVSGASYTQWISVVRSPIDGQKYLRRTTGAGTTDPSLDTTNWQPESPRARKSLQRVVVSFTGASGTATIAAVDPAKTIISNLGATSSASTAFETGLVTLTNSTTVTVTRAQNLGNTLTVAVQVEEFY